jgi:adenylosuccinate lyase
MPFKRNPVRAEKINSLARFLASLQHVAWDNAAHSLLERTLDDSANRRTILPEAFLATDELLRTASSILSNLEIDESAMRNNLSTYGPFAATERLLMALVKAGANRQDMHEHIRSHSMRAWESLRQGGANPLADDLTKDAEVLEYIPEQEIRTLMASSSYIGDAPQRARRMARAIEESLK